MAQFASTLYPQTNLTNPVLLELRQDRTVDGCSLADSVRLSLHSCKRNWWAYDEASDAQIDHARRVLTRLASFTG